MIFDTEGHTDIWTLDLERGVATPAITHHALEYEWPRVVRALEDRRGLGFTGVGAFFGPFLGVSLSLLAVQHVEAGVAASIMAISPILVIPAVVLLHRERVGVAGVGGAMLAVAGVSLLFR